jgi:hypothetical protein
VDDCRLRRDDGQERKRKQIEDEFQNRESPSQAEMRIRFAARLGTAAGLRSARVIASRRSREPTRE